MSLHCNKRVLFILKKRSYDCYWGEVETPTDPAKLRSSGLSNSATFVHDMLLSCGVNSKLVQVLDNNCIDREVALFNPDIVIIEAMWVVPEKFKVLRRLHPRVKWVIRNHSNWPFASNEGNLIDWSLKYMRLYNDVLVSCNKKETNDSLRQLMRSLECFEHLSDQQITDSTPYLPNYYPVSPTSIIPIKHSHNTDQIRIGNFGAIRPLKNNLIQAIAALIFARSVGKKLVYYINGGRIEGKADPILKSIEMLFAHAPDATLINVGWLNHKQFTEKCGTIDIIMQVSFDETFNIVAADAINNGTCVVGSKEIPWLHRWCVADCTDVRSIVQTLKFVYRFGWLDHLFSINKDRLLKYVEQSKKHWFDWLNSIG